MDSSLIDTDSDSRVSALLHCALRGSDEAMLELLEGHREYLTTVVQVEIDSGIRVKESESDIVQETLIKAGQAFAGFRGVTIGELRRWLKVIVQNRLCDLHRKYSGATRDAKRELAGINPAALSDAQIAGPLSNLVTQENAERVASAIALLPEHYRKVLSLRFFERMSFEQIGLALQREPDATRKLFYRAVEALGNALEDFSGTGQS